MAPRGSGDVTEVSPPQAEATLDRQRAEDLVLRLVAAHADSLLRVARRYSLCADDAHDAYQRGLEILMRHAARLDPDGAPGWLHTVVKREAMAIDRSRRRMLGGEDFEPDALEAQATDTPEERALAADRVARSAEALHGLKPQEVRALWLKALGHSYEQICSLTGWSYTKVNRCLAEGRKSFLERYAGIESGAECARLAPLLSAFVDGEADAARTMELRAHLRRCLACRASVRGLHEVAHPLAVVLPATGMAAAGAGADHAGSFFFRVYEAVSLHLHERGASSVMRAQAIVDTVTAYKMAAVAASAAALAGGGFAVDGAFNTRVDRPGVAVRDLAGVAASAPAVRSARAKATHHAKPRAKAKAVRSRHRAHRTPPAAPRTPPTTTPAPAYASAPPAPPPAPAAQAPASQPVATTASASAPSGGSSAAAEFGIEGP
jgi:RNA polymerase sigma factor (sigma-70 family)